MRLTQALFARIGDYSKKYYNLPDRYLKRSMEQVYWRNPKGPQYRPGVAVERKKFRFIAAPSWSQQFYEANTPGRLRKKVFIEPIRHWSYFRGDRVEVLVGKDKGKQGIVQDIYQERNWVIVEGLNTYLQKFSPGKDEMDSYVRVEAPLLVTDQVALVDPSDLQKTAIEWRYTESGDHVRVSLRTGRIIPIPHSSEETIDYKSKSTYKEHPKDTMPDDAAEITFKPELKTFEMDIMDNMGIKEDRIPPKSYWY